MTRPPFTDELRADFLQCLWAYIEATKSGVLEWPAQAADSQSTPIEPLHEKAFLWEIAARANALRAALGESGGQSG